jgi:hypothetical protein
MTNLRDLILDENLFEGTLSDLLSCGNCSDTLTTLRSRNNPLEGTIPDRLFEFGNLHQLHLMGTRLGGTIPTGIGRLTALEDLNLSYNPFLAAGAVLPTELGQLTGLVKLYVSASSVSGTVPASFASLARLEGLRIDGTLMTGSIPAEVCALGRLEVVSHSADVTCTCPNDVCTLV